MQLLFAEFFQQRHWAFLMLVLMHFICLSSTFFWLYSKGILRNISLTQAWLFRPRITHQFLFLVYGEVSTLVHLPRRDTLPHLRVTISEFSCNFKLSHTSFWNSFRIDKRAVTIHVSLKLRIFILAKELRIIVTLLRH